MKKRTHVTSEKDPKYLLLPWGGKIRIGPGTVPTSPSSLPETDMKRMIAAARAASRAGVFDSGE